MMKSDGLSANRPPKVSAPKRAISLSAVFGPMVGNWHKASFTVACRSLTTPGRCKVHSRVLQCGQAARFSLALARNRSAAIQTPSASVSIAPQSGQATGYSVFYRRRSRTRTTRRLVK